MRKLVLLVALCLLASATLAACGGDDGDDETTADTTTQTTTTQAGGGGGGGGTISLSADPSTIAYEQASLSGQAGNATIEFDNPASIPHDVCVEDPSGDEVGCSDQITDDTTSLTVNLEPGTYTFYCSVSGHREGGMEGPLTVE